MKPKQFKVKISSPLDVAVMLASGVFRQDASNGLEMNFLLTVKP